MYRVKAYFKDSIVSKTFVDMYDAIEWKDNADAHYPYKTTFEDGVNPMRTWIIDCWDTVMDHERNPLRHIPDLHVRHMIMQVLAFLWSAVFAIGIADSILAFGISAMAHVLLLGVTVITVATFKMAETNPGFFSLKKGYHTISRSRQHLWVNGQKVKLPEGDPGGEHE